MKALLRNLIGYTGFQVTRIRKYRDGQAFPEDFDDSDIELFLRVRKATMTSCERVFALARAVEYIVRSGLKGSVVECGVWKGGSMMAVALTLLRLGRKDYPLYLFDTFAGMPAPVQADGDRAAEKWASNRAGDHSAWCYSPLEEVRANVMSTGYDPQQLFFVKGKVEDTIPTSAPEQIALLRLDTDFYESTKHELEHLFPRLIPGGVLIIDDYGCWQGSRKATDEYFQQHKTSILLNRIDHSARVGIKS